MANIKKNFNFRNGVQVDDDNLLVTSTGLVGIGTTVPTEALDIRGNLNVSGSADITQANIGILTVTTLEPTKIIGAGISVVSGIVTATGSGIVTFYGDARFLQGMPTSQWADVDVGLGFTSIYNTGGNVGVATVHPRFTVQVGGDVDSSQNGVGISSVGNIKATGIVTASSFVGNLSGNITGATTISGNVDLNADIDVDGHTNLDNVSIAGIATVIDLDVDGHTNIDNVSVAGVSTFAGLLDVNGQASLQDVSVVGTTTFFPTGNFTRFFTEIDAQGGIVVGSVGFSTFNSSVDINSDLDVDGHTNLDNVSVAGVSTFSGPIIGTSGATINNVSIGIESPSAISATGSNLNLTSDGGTTSIANKLEVSGISTFSDDVAIVGLVTTKNLLVTGITTLTGDVNATGAINADSFEAPNLAVTQKIGVGSTDTPVSDIQVTKTSIAEIQICSTDSIAQINVGKEVGTSKTHTSQIRFGGGAGAPYSASGTALDIINYDTGNFNYHLSANNPNAVVGDFHWHKGFNSARLMTLTGIGGSLGIGKTNPTVELDVEGGGNFSGNVTVGNNMIVNGAFIGNLQGTLTGNVTGTLEGNSNVTVGISTLNNLTIAGIMTASQANITALGIGTNPDPERPVRVNDLPSERFFVSATGSIGIQTSNILAGVGINASQTIMSVGAIGVGVTVVHKAVDFSNAGLSTNRMMVLPKMNNSGRNGLQNVVSGAVIYNTSTNKMQVYNGSAWQDCN